VSILLGSACAVVAAVAGPPLAAITAAVPEHGRILLPASWWRGGGASGRRIVGHAAAAGLAAGVAAAFIGWSVALPAWWMLTVLGVGLAVVDIEHHRLPDMLIVPVVVTALVCLVIGSLVAGTGGALLRAVAAAIVVMAGLAGLAVLTGQIGGGDAKLTGCLALLLAWDSWTRLIVGLLFGVFLAAAAGLVLVTVRRARHLTPIAAGPALLAGALAAAILFHPW
jgi:leader peptidase (prepilin peptidase)/N-methyltransferase